MTDHRLTDDVSRLLRTGGRLLLELADLRERELSKCAQTEAENTRLHRSIEELHAQLEARTL